MNKLNQHASQGQPDATMASTRAMTAAAHPRQAVVHPCLIDGRPHIVYPRGLKDRAPLLFQRLYLYFSQQGYTLREDRRSGSGRHFRRERRRWAPLLLVTANLFFPPLTCQALEENHPTAHQEIRLQLIYKKEIHPGLETPSASVREENITQATPVESAVARRLYRILQTHYRPQQTDPAYSLDDLRQIANYYAEFAEVVRLLDDLAERPWQLVFDESDWYTTATGSAVSVDSATIHFNTRSAAQLRLNNGCRHSPVCIASPADALLHELLHTHSMLVETQTFVAQGGMSNMLYPYKHEYAVIDSERRLYASMSRQDAIRRPQRREHTGRLVRARCPTCID